MSWIFGFYSKLNIHSTNISKPHPDPAVCLSSNKYYLAAGGNKNTLLCEKDSSGTKFFVCGLGISNNAAKLLNKNDWKEVLKKNDFTNQNGHFCGVTINNQTLSFFTDQLGLREFHIYENNCGGSF